MCLRLDTDHNLNGYEHKVLRIICSRDVYVLLYCKMLKIEIFLLGIPLIKLPYKFYQCIISNVRLVSCLT